MKWNVPMLALVTMLGAVTALALVGCAEQPEVTTETIEQVPEAAEEVYTDEPETPGTDEVPGVAVEEMTDETPPHVEEQGEEAAEDTPTEEQPEPPAAPDAGN